ncbi:MAG: segregation and condensation protein A [Thioalkalivibrionaceae bacterium]
MTSTEAGATGDEDNKTAPADLSQDHAGTQARESSAGEGGFVARVGDTALSQLPEDLYIPPDALRVFLDRFEGPLDLLLYLIRKQNFDILEIPIQRITAQYMAYIELMQAMRFELAGEYLVMAALLAEIKSRMLLPRPPAADEDEEDPRVRLLRQLEEYERFKDAAERLSLMPRLDREWFSVSVDRCSLPAPPMPVPELDELLNAMAGVLARARLTRHHAIAAESLSVRERMSLVLAKLDRLGDSESLAFEALFDLDEGVEGVVVSLLAALELAKAGLLVLMQSQPFTPLTLRRAPRSAVGERELDRLLDGLVAVSDER